ncbi:MAG: hypothetical protein BWY17_02423 [Deltaproteobacteria bacterium ADurb.Bin207]|jgi:hypothetical protein|nr:MAG: hypothetical protein BWY17_02423 [Deltaproteobacteria bacterium ADurb.Bin207]
MGDGVIEGKAITAVFWVRCEDSTVFCSTGRSGSCAEGLRRDGNFPRKSVPIAILGAVAASNLEKE